MRIDVRPILHAPGKRLDFRFSMDLSDVEFAGRHPISRPVAVEGAVTNTADLLELELTARTTLDAVCDRCGKEFLQDKIIPFRCLLAGPVFARLLNQARSEDPAADFGSVWELTVLDFEETDCVPEGIPQEAPDGEPEFHLDHPSLLARTPIKY